MADFNALAATSRTLRRLLLDRMSTPGLAVTLAPPDVTVGNVSGARVNLYLYQVMEQAQLKNQAIPGHEHPAGYGAPPLSLTLRYLLSAHARSEDQQDSDLIAQALLGDAMLVLHDFGSRIDNLRLVTNRAGAIGDPVLDAVLQEEFERVKLVLAPVPLDEMAKLWSAMPQANFRRSVIYDASVVQIEGRLPRHQARPVETRRILALVARPPRIEAAYLTPPPPPADLIRDTHVAIGEEITIEHAPMSAERLYVRLGTLRPIRVPLPSTGTIRLTIPDDQYPIDLDHPALTPIPPADRLQPGALEVSLLSVSEADGIEGGLDRGQPVNIERAMRSNTALLQLLPTTATRTPANASAANANAVLRVTGERLWADDLSSQVIVGDVSVAVRPPKPGDPWAAPTATQIEVPVSAIAAALKPSPTPYPVAVQVNGARSRDTGLTFRLDP